jgi:hypothetical protein
MSVQAQPSGGGTLSHPQFYPGQQYRDDDMLMTQRYFTYDSDRGLVSGIDVDVTIFFDHPRSIVWPVLQDHNSWQSPHGYFYPSPIQDLYTDTNGDLGTTTYRLKIKPPEGEMYEYPDDYRVVKVIPERTIVLHQTVPTDDQHGGVSGGFHTFLLQDNAEGNCVVSVAMQHSTRKKEPGDDPIEHWRAAAPGYEQFWSEIFVPELKRLVSQSV